MKKADRVLEQAEQVAQTVESWADLSNALFAPFHGIVTSAYRTPAERRAFLKTTQYKKIRALLNQAVDRFGLVEGAMPKKSGRFVVRVPRSLHVALEQEARQEGVSLNQLVVTKLATQLRDMTDPRQPRDKPRRRKPA
jgi:hypothetical protein